jgi:hypothetical protein
VCRIKAIAIQYLNDLLGLNDGRAFLVLESIEWYARTWGSYDTIIEWAVLRKADLSDES